MRILFEYPLALCAISFIALSTSVWIGATFLSRSRGVEVDTHEEFSTILAATLTLLGLIIGFTFSMAISRYDQRKNLEEEEANAIGTEYVRADLLPAADGAKVRKLLKEYLNLRLRFYEAPRDIEIIKAIAVERGRLQGELWRAILGPAAAQPTPIVTLVVAGMNDVLNAEGYTQAAWWNRIPHAAWLLMIFIAICSNLLLGYGARKARSEVLLLLVLPAVVSISFFLIADIDSPRGGVIHVSPQNLQSLADSLGGP